MQAVDMPNKKNIVELYLEQKNIPSSSRTETVYRYHVELDASSRLCGCEMLLRTAENNVVLTAVLPIAIRPEEARGIVRTLANYNRERLEKDMDGIFDFDYLRGRIQFTMQISASAEAEELAEEIDYCLEQVQNASNTMMRLVCDESEIVREEEQAKLDAERRAAERERREKERAARAAKNNGASLIDKVMNFVGLTNKNESAPLRLEAPDEDFEETEESSQSEPAAAQTVQAPEAEAAQAPEAEAAEKTEE